MKPVIACIFGAFTRVKFFQIQKKTFSHYLIPNLVVIFYMLICEYRPVLADVKPAKAAMAAFAEAA
jgi:hypothetical protein